jgi:Glycosyl hydrolases family 2, TIM barrel domain/Glycosyl hydrolases family 2
MRLFAVPPDYVTRFHVETDFDPSFTDAVLHVMLAIRFEGSREAQIEFNLKDPGGEKVSIRPASLRLSPHASETIISVPVVRPQKWDSEHPRLYTLEAAVEINGSASQVLVKKFGFRKVEVRGNELYVNGDPVKLRGGCRHDVYPSRGRSTTPSLDEQDVLLLKNANFNFVRTSHYPPTQSFLDCCDRHGLYIEEESAVCFVDQSFGSRVAAQDEPSYTAQFMNQFAEMIERDRDHPSVIIWSLGNESKWGSNFAREYSYVKLEDATRPVIFSFPDSVREGVKACDIFSEHYPNFNADFSSASVPVLNDEFGHVPCYNQETLRRDPGVRNYWGRSINEFWKGMVRAKGCLGGSIWASIDEVFMLPSSCVGCGEWGIIDGWRREKPEYWLAKKAYSPTKLPDRHVQNPGSGNPLRIPVANEFNHTNLDEIRIQWNVGTERGEIRNLKLAPHSSGWLLIPAHSWQNGDVIHINFVDPADRLIDDYKIPIGEPIWRFPAIQGPAPQMREDTQFIRLAGKDFEIVFSKASGLVLRASFTGHTVLEGGPLLNLAPATLRNWWLTSIWTASTDDETVINISGNYQREGNFSDERLVYVTFEVRVDGTGLITTNFKVDGIPSGLNELGVAYILPQEMDQLSWSRKSLWSVYPPDHIGRRSGVADKTRATGTEEFRAKPSWPWSQDTKDFFLFGKGDAGGRGTNDFRSQKENIWFASGIISRTGVRARAESQGDHSVRAEIEDDGRVRLNINSLWAYPNLDWGNECPALPVTSSYEGSIRLRLTDSDPTPPDFQDSS